MSGYHYVYTLESKLVARSLEGLPTGKCGNCPTAGTGEPVSPPEGYSVIFDDVRFERLEAQGRAEFARQLAELKEEWARLR